MRFQQSKSHLSVSLLFLFTRLAPLSQPIICETDTNRHMVSCVFFTLLALKVYFIPIKVGELSFSRCDSAFALIAFVTHNTPCKSAKSRHLSTPLKQICLERAK